MRLPDPSARSILVIGALLPMLFACREEREAVPPRPAATAVSDPVYALKDSFETDAGPSFFAGARLYRDGRIMDTVFSRFGFTEVGRDSFVYRKLRVHDDTVRDPARERGRDTVAAVLKQGADGGIYLYDQASEAKTRLSDDLPFYHFLSSPHVAQGSLLYWGVAKADSGFRIYAMRYGFAARKIDSMFLYIDGLGTDDIAYFPKPVFKNGGYVYPAPDGTVFSLDTALRGVGIEHAPYTGNRRWTLDREVEGTLRLAPENGDAPGRLAFQPDRDSDLGIARDRADHRRGFFILPEAPVLEKLGVAGPRHPQGDYCWQWQATLRIGTYFYGFGLEGGADEAAATLVSASGFRKTCD